MEQSRKQKGKSKRTDNDNYPTPQPLCDAICERLSRFVEAPQFLVEPSAGNGNFVQAAVRSWPGIPVHAIELRPEEREACIQRGASSFTSGDWAAIAAAWKPAGVALVLGNPPYSQASEHIRAFLEHMSEGSSLAFLLKMNFLGGKVRAENLWPLRRLKAIIPVLGRPSFKKTELASNDTNEYGVYVWQVGYRGTPTIEFPHIVWKGK